MRFRSSENGFTGIAEPLPLDKFKEIVRSTGFVESLRKIRHDAFVNAMRDEAWQPHWKFVDEFMRERDISF
jgi:hypothetical protein